MMARALRWFASLVLVGVIGYSAFTYLWGVPAVESRPTVTDEKSIADGKYLAAMGDCTSCHTAEGGERFAGGRPFDTPFGKLYSSNITPDPQTGIGAMTSAEFYQLMAYGADSVLSPLYPAMPYTSFHLITRADSDALHAYFMSLAPVSAPAKANELTFPFSIRPLMFGWNLLFAERGPFKSDEDKHAAWNRGAYLVRGLGHCGECHTPRNVAGAMEAGKAMSGAVIEGVKAPDLRGDALKQRGWTRHDLALYFETGTSPQGTPFGEMFPVVKNSLRFLTHEDRMAIATFLMDVDADEPSKGTAAVAALGARAHPNTSGQSLYITYCASCHGAEGQGIESTMPALKNNSVVSQADGFNLIAVVAAGVRPQTLSLTEGYGPMPAFRDRLSVVQMTDLANYIRDAFAVNASASPVLTEADVEGILQQTATQ